MISLSSNPELKMKILTSFGMSDGFCVACMTSIQLVSKGRWGYILTLFHKMLGGVYSKQIDLAKHENNFAPRQSAFFNLCF